MSRISALALCLSASGLWSTNAAATTVVADGGVSETPSAPATSSDAGASSVDAQPAVSETTEPSHGWEISFTSYLWAAGTQGEVGLPRNGEEVEVDQSFTDVLGSLKFAFMGAMDAKRGRFVTISDLMFLSVGTKVESIRDPAFFSGKVDASVLLVSAAAGYRVVDKGPMFVDLLVGGRFFSLDVDMKLRGPLNTYTADASPTNFSPFLAGRMRLPLNETWAVGLYGDVAGPISDAAVKWQLVGTVQHDVSRRWRLFAGYRHMSINHSKRDLEFDIDLSGPILGATYRF